MIQQIFPATVWNLGLAFLDIKIDVVYENAIQQRRILLFNACNGLVQPLADILLDILQSGDEFALIVSVSIIPARYRWDKECLPVRPFIIENFSEIIRR